MTETLDPVDELAAVLEATLGANALRLTASRGGYVGGGQPHATLPSDPGAVEAVARGLLARRVAEPSRTLPTEPPAAPPTLDAISTFLANAETAMRHRMREGERRGWGTTWQTDYPDADVSARLARAVEHLERALSGLRLGAVGDDEMQKRAADVANQAFMLADPTRLRDRP